MRGFAMTGRDAGSARRRKRRFVSGLWIAAALILIAGFTLRPLARYLVGHDLRMIAVVAIAAGLVVAVLAWIGEWLIGAGNSD